LIDYSQLFAGQSRESAETRPPSQRATPGYGRLAAWLTLVGVLTVAAFAASSVGGHVPSDTFYRYSTAIAGAIFSAILVGAILLIARGGDKSELFALKPPRDSRWALWACLAILIASFGFDYLYGVAFGPFDAEQGIPSFWDGSRTPQFLANLLIVAAVGPIVEELMFRGLGFWLFERFGTWAAISITGVLFALLHGYAALLPAFLVTGLLLGWLRSRTGSIYPGMFVHGLFNGVAVMLAITLT
jgi:membrane protease YdiL (CAAX protease family)